MANQIDRRRVNGPLGGTTAPVYALDSTRSTYQPPQRTRAPNELRKIFLKTGLTPSASGSAYLELETSAKPNPIPRSHHSPSGLKLTCSVHGPRPLPRSAPFSPQLVLSTRIKYAPFASRQRKGFVPDSSERDLAVHLETALRGVLIGERWPKSGVSVIITVLEGEDDCSWGNDAGKNGSWGLMSILSGCITVASAALVDAGIDCVDLVTGGVAAYIPRPAAAPQLVLDPCPSDHEEIKGACVVAYLQSRDEITEVWAKGDFRSSHDGTEPETSGIESLLDNAVEAASAARLVLVEAIKESRGETSDK